MLGEPARIEKAIELRSDVAEFHKNLGLALRACHLPEDASSSFQRAIAIDSGFAEAMFQLASTDMDLDRLQSAKKGYRNVLTIWAAHAESYFGLGVILSQQHKHAEAIEHYQQAIRYKANYLAAYFNLGNTYRELGQLGQAAASYQQAIESGDQSVDAHFNLAMTLAELRRYEAARLNYRQAILLQPSYLAAYNNLGLMLKDLGEYEAAVDILWQAIQLDAGVAQLHYNLGCSLQPLNEFEKAADSFERAIDLDDSLAQAHTNLANVHRAMGLVDKAKRGYRYALKLDPRLSEAHFNFAKSEKHHEHDDEIAAIEMLLRENDLTNDQRIHLSFGIGKAYEDLRDYEKSYALIAAGNRLKRATYSYCIESSRSYLASIKDLFSDGVATMASNRQCWDSTPIFIVGMPRSGTSLVEQILASHPHVYGAGELRVLENLVSSTPFPHCLTSNRCEIDSWGHRYTSQLRELQPDVRFITDKMPANFRYCGLIQMILPRAKIIHCCRSPMDTCWSIFKTLFAEQQNFAYDQDELGQFYAIYLDLMDFWQTRLPNSIYEIQYESLVNDQETETRRLLDHCELAWDDRCLLFHETVRPVTTASNTQVRRPMYKDSIGRWRNYAGSLRQLQDRLRCR